LSDIVSETARAHQQQQGNLLRQERVDDFVQNVADIRTYLHTLSQLPLREQISGIFAQAPQAQGCDTINIQELD
jgi:hypothetical protein